MKGRTWLSIVNHVLDEKGYVFSMIAHLKMSSKEFYKHSVLCLQLSGKNAVCFMDLASLLDGGLTRMLPGQCGCCFYSYMDSCPGVVK